MLGLQQTGFRPLGVLVENICDVLVTAEGLWSYGSHEVCENELERELDLVVGGFGMSQLVTLVRRAYVAVWHTPVEDHAIVTEVLQIVKTMKTIYTWTARE